MGIGLASLRQLRIPAVLNMAGQRPKADNQSYALLRQFIEDLTELYKQHRSSSSDLPTKLKQFIIDSKNTLTEHEQEQFRYVEKNE